MHEHRANKAALSDITQAHAVHLVLFVDSIDDLLHGDGGKRRPPMLCCPSKLRNTYVVIRIGINTGQDD